MGRGVGGADHRPSGDRSDREQQAEHHKGALGADQVDENRGEYCADGKPGHCHPLEHAEDTSHDLAWRQPLQKGPTGDIAQADARTRNRQQRRRRRENPNHGDGQTSGEHTAQQRWRQTRSTNKASRSHGAEKSPHPDDCPEIADSWLPDTQQLDGQNHEKHVERSVHDRLHSTETDDDTGAAFGEHHRDTSEKGPDWRDPNNQRRFLAGRGAGDGRSRRRQQNRHRQKDKGRVADLEQETGDERTRKCSGAFRHGRHHVGRNRLIGPGAELWNESNVGGPGCGDQDCGQRGEPDHQRRSLPARHCPPRQSGGGGLRCVTQHQSSVPGQPIGGCCQ